MKETIKMQENNPLATAPISKLLMQFAIPSVLSMLVDALYNMVDQIFIGQGVGYLGIAATTVTFPFVTIILSIGTLLGIGGSVYTSMRLNQRVKGTFQKAVGIATVVSVIGWLACELFPAGILQFFGMNEPAYLEFAVRCIRIFLFGMFAAGFQVVSTQYYLATGQALKAMLLSVFRPLLLMMPLIHIFSRIWALDGILYASPTADILTTLIVAELVWLDMRKKQKEV